MIHPMLVKYAMEKSLLAHLLEERRQAQAQAERKAIKKAKTKDRRLKRKGTVDF